MPGFNFDPDDDPMANEGYDVEEPPDEGQDLPVPGAPPVDPTADAIPASPTEARKMNELQQEEDENENYEELVSNVDKRLRIAQFFRYILDNQLFNDDSTEAKIVQNRIRRYAREQVEILFGMKPGVSAATTAVVQASPFTAEEVEALKALASATINSKKKTELLKIGPKSEPAPVRPAMTPIKVPNQESVAAPVQPKPQPKPLLQAKKPVPVTKPQPQAPTATPGQNPFQNDPRVPEQYRNDDTVRIKNGKVYIQLRNTDGQLLWMREKNSKRITPMLKDVTPPAQPTGIQPLPMPSIDMLPHIMEQKAVIDSQLGLSRAANIMDDALTGRVRIG